MRQLFTVSQLHPVQSEPDIERELMHMVSDELLGAFVLIQARMRGPELKEWLLQHTDAQNQQVTSFDREHFRMTWSVPSNCWYT